MNLKEEQKSSELCSKTEFKKVTQIDYVTEFVK